MEVIAVNAEPRNQIAGGVLLSPNRLARSFKRVHVHHPAENDRIEFSAGLGTSLLGKDRALKSELAQIGVAALVPGRHAKFRVQMPLRHSKGDAFI